jgi:dienelactone hydrolase
MATVSLEEHSVSVDSGSVLLDGDLVLPRPAHGLVLFAHGSGSSRLSPRNRHVANVFHEARLATLLVDLLTPGEEAVDERTRALRFDIGFLEQRLVGCIDWLLQRPDASELRIGCFGASTGAAAALVAAAERPTVVQAVVSRGGRPDLAQGRLAEVLAPTLFIVGGNDTAVIPLNEQALGALRCEKRMEIVPGATHLFEERGALDRVAELARDWFVQHLGRAATA